ncbi:hypothetical protein BX070DRAFT_46501 [Coemansia spiralis]|nr:hypothetical protein BX070DRAFT_46501 [Coemansia spiralis]
MKRGASSGYFCTWPNASSFFFIPKSFYSCFSILYPHYIYSSFLFVARRIRSNSHHRPIFFPSTSYQPLFRYTFLSILCQNPTHFWHIYPLLPLIPSIRPVFYLHTPMASRLLCQHRVVALTRGQAPRPFAVARHYPRRTISTTAAVAKAGREWDYIDGPSSNPLSKLPRQQEQKAPGAADRGSEKSANGAKRNNAPGKQYAPIQRAKGAASAGGFGGKAPPSSMSDSGNMHSSSATSGRDDTARGTKGPSLPQPPQPQQHTSAGMEPISPKMVGLLFNA